MIKETISNQQELLAMCKSLVDMLDDGNIIIEARVESITDKQFRALHVWFGFAANELNNGGIPRIKSLSGKHGKWCKETFKQDIYKPFIKSFKGMNSTKDQGKKTPTECLEALTAHIATEYNCTLPPFPSIESMSMAALLKT